MIWISLPLFLIEDNKTSIVAVDKNQEDEVGRERDTVARKSGDSFPRRALVITQSDVQVASRLHSLRSSLLYWVRQAEWVQEVAGQLPQ